MGRLDNKVAVITGAGSGYGAETARRFVVEGAKIVVNDLRAEAAQEVADALGEAALAHAGDVTNRDDVRAMLALAADRFGGLDILFNNAGFTHVNRPLLEVPEEEFDLCFAVNVKAIYYAVLESVPLFEARGGGVILNTASTAGLRPRPGLTWYNGSKGAAVILSKSLAVELAPKKIRVNALCPVMGVTGMLERFMGGPDSPELRAKFAGTVPLGRLSEAADVANAALYLASDEANFITGVALEIDGGRCV